jgi:competence protein ComEA
MSPFPGVFPIFAGGGGNPAPAKLPVEPTLRSSDMKKIKLASLLPAFVLAFPMLACAGPVDVNSADAETLSAELKGVGMAKAQAIVEYRKAHGPFKSVDELALVKGIGARTVEINRQDILLQPAGEKSRK